MTPDIPDDFQGKLNWLFNTIKKADGTMWTNQEVANRIGITRGYISHLRTKVDVNNPSLEVVKSLVKHFGVGLQFFDDDFNSSNLDKLYHTIIGRKLATRLEDLENLHQADLDALFRIIDNTIKASQNN